MGSRRLSGCGVASDFCLSAFSSLWWLAILKRVEPRFLLKRLRLATRLTMSGWRYLAGSVSSACRQWATASPSSLKAIVTFSMGHRSTTMVTLMERRVLQLYPRGDHFWKAPKRSVGSRKICAVTVKSEIASQVSERARGAITDTQSINSIKPVIDAVCPPANLFIFRFGCESVFFRFAQVDRLQREWDWPLMTTQTC